MAKDTFRAGSRKDWTPQNDQAVMNREQIAVGCLQRIADAVEKIAESQAAVLAELNESRRLRRQVRALRGVITRQKAQEPS
jgi:hypothetical protein